MGTAMLKLHNFPLPLTAFGHKGYGIYHYLLLPSFYLKNQSGGGLLV